MRGHIGTQCATSGGGREVVRAAVMADTTPEAVEAKWNDLSLEEIRSRAQNFSSERDWDQFHSPRNLLCALVGEVGELAECFQWKGEVAKNLEGFTDAEKVHVGEELSDVLVYLIRLGDKCGIDLPKAVIRKMTKNAEKYPAHLAKGRAAKYTAYVTSSEASRTDEAQAEDREDDTKSNPDNVSEDNAKSELGKKEYWSKFYAEEIVNINDDGQLGEDWFSTEIKGQSLSRFVADQINRTFDAIRDRDGEIQRNVIDIGCGSGIFALELIQNELAKVDNILGIDYVDQGVEMAYLTLEGLKSHDNRGTDNHLHEKVTFENQDFLSEAFVEKYRHSFSIAHDKGTLDAIYLMDERALSIYAANLKGILRTPGLFVITSCNLTKPELLAVFKDFTLIGELPHKTFKFGGKQGSTLSTLAFSL